MNFSLPYYEYSRTFRCLCDAGGSSEYAYSYDIIVSRGGGVTATVQSSGAIDGAYRQTDYYSSGNINTTRVDSTSYVYDAIDNIKNYSNVMSVSEIDASTIGSYLNLSKPSIVLTAYPTVYENVGGNMTSLASVGGVHYLNYTITITNETDPTPATTTYDCCLYIDLNADGRYSDEEKLYDITVMRAGSVVFPAIDGEGDEYYRLSAGVTYSVSREVPEQYAGIIPWKLEVVKNGAERIHASVHNYTRIDPPEPETIKILQIKGGHD